MARRISPPIPSTWTSTGGDSDRHDTGPVVALLHRRDRQHAWVRVGARRGRTADFYMRGGRLGSLLSAWAREWRPGCCVRASLERRPETRLMTSASIVGTAGRSFPRSCRARAPNAPWRESAHESAVVSFRVSAEEHDLSQVYLFEQRIAMSEDCFPKYLQHNSLLLSGTPPTSPA